MTAVTDIILMSTAPAGRLTDYSAEFRDVVFVVLGLMLPPELLQLYRQTSTDIINLKPTLLPAYGTVQPWASLQSAHTWKDLDTLQARVFMGEFTGPGMFGT